MATTVIPPKVLAALSRMIDEGLWGEVSISFQDGAAVYLKVMVSQRLGPGRKP
jgi:hypothetical protein